MGASRTAWILTASALAAFACALILIVIGSGDFGPYGVRAIFVGPGPSEVRDTCRPVTEWLEAERASLGADRLALEYGLWRHLEPLPYDVEYERPRLVVGPRQWPPPLLAYEWSADGGWGWSADEDVSDAEAAELLREHGYGDPERYGRAIVPLDPRAGDTTSRR